MPMTSPPLRLSTLCPDCGKPLRRIKRKTNESYFLGCSGYPACRFTDSYDDALADCLDWYAASIDVDLKKLIALAHPDYWPQNPLAHEITVALNALREKTAEMLEGALV